MTKRKMHKTVAALALFVPFAGGAALASDMGNKQGMETHDKSSTKHDTSTMKGTGGAGSGSEGSMGTGGTGNTVGGMGTDTRATKPSPAETMACGEKIASQAPTARKSAELLTSIAEGYAAHAEMLGKDKAAKEERALLQKTSASYREMAKKFTTMATQLEAARSVKDSKHEMSAEKMEKAAQMQLKTAQLQKELADDLTKEAEEMRASAEQMRSQSGVGGSGFTEPTEQMPEQEKEQDQMTWPPMPEQPVE